jgi:hypothetical protein
MVAKHFPSHLIRVFFSPLFRYIIIPNHIQDYQLRLFNGYDSLFSYPYSQGVILQTLIAGAVRQAHILHPIDTLQQPKAATYDHRFKKTALPVRSAVLKLVTGGLVVRWVTTGEYPLLYVFGFFVYLTASWTDNMGTCGQRQRARDWVVILGSSTLSEYCTVD